MMMRDEHVATLVKQRYIMPEVAMEYAHNKAELERLLKKV